MLATVAVMFAPALPVMLVEENCTVIPAGNEPVESATLPLNPFAGVRLIELEADPPGAALMLDGEAFSVKLEAATVTLKLAFAVKLPFVPVMLIGYTPGVMELAAETVKVLLPAPGAAMAGGANPTVKPLGDDADSEMDPLKPLAIPLDRIRVVLAPG